MAAITAIAASSQPGSYTCNESTLSADDTITIDTSKKQVLVLRNAGGSPLTCTVDGDGATSVAVPGLGVVTTSGGYAIAVPAGESRAVHLSAISEYCKGVVHLLGASGMKATLFNF